MSNILRSRQGEADGGAALLKVQMQHANAIAAAKQALPPGYVNNPGAILLAQEWAQARGVDLLTTIQTVSFIGGKPVIDATMQRALAARAGYDVRPTEITDTQATVEVRKDGELRGVATFSMADAEVAGLTSKENWRKNPKSMLVARATTQAMRWYAPEVMVGVVAADEDFATDDPVEVLAPVAEVEEVEEVEEAEIIEPPIKDAQVLKLAAKLDGLEVIGDLQAAWASTELGREVAALADLTEAEGKQLWGVVNGR